jgi:hypothetical protein
MQPASLILFMRVAAQGAYALSLIALKRLGELGVD